MPTSYEFKGDLILVTAMEDVTLTEVFDAVVNAINGPLFRPGMGCLIHDFKSSIIFDFGYLYVFAKICAVSKARIAELDK